MSGTGNDIMILYLRDSSLEWKHLVRFILRGQAIGTNISPYVDVLINPSSPSNNVATSMYTVEPNVWHMVEIHWKGDASVGGAQVWLDGISIYNNFELDTSTWIFDTVEFGPNGSSSYGNTAPVEGSIIYIDDLKVSTTGPIGNYAANRAYAVNTNGNGHIVLKNLALQYAATANLLIDADDVSVQGCDITGAGWNAHAGQTIIGDGIVLTTGATNTELLRNAIHGNLRYGVYNSGTANKANASAINYNLIYGNNGAVVSFR